MMATADTDDSYLSDPVSVRLRKLELATQKVDFQGIAMLRERLDAQEKQIKDLWRRFHSLLEAVEARDLH